MKVKRVLVGYDGSQPAEAAFKHSLKLAVRVKAVLMVLSVVQVSEPAEMVEASAEVDSFKERYSESFRRLHLEARKSRVRIKTLLAVGHPAEQIIRYAIRQRADMIVLGRSRHSRIKEWLMGSVVGRVISHAPCSVTVIK